jgi:hypothetical protein
VFRRGFPECVTVRAEDFLAHADTLFSRAPIQHLILTECGKPFARVMESSHLTRVRVLDIRAGCDVRALVRSPHLGGLKGLVLRFAGLESKEAAPLATAPTLAGLTTLDLYGNNLQPAGARALAASPYWGGLTDLVLGDNAEIGDAGAAALAGPKSRLSGLTRLHLSFAAIGDNGACTLADSPRLSGLRVLDLGFNEIGAHCARALADSPYLKGLTHLGLRGNPIGAAARKTLARRHGRRIRL